MEPEAQQPTVQESPVQQQPPQAPPVQEQAPQEPCVPEQADNDAQPSAGRNKPAAKTRAQYQRRKARLLPEITRLALDGHSGESIARRFELPGRTVTQWLKEARRQWLAAAAQSCEEMAAVEWARLNGLYREALDAWRKAQAEVDAWVDGRRKSGGKGKAGRKKLRAQPPRRNDALLGRALAVLRELRQIRGAAMPAAAPAGRPAVPPPLDLPRRISAEELERLSDEDLVALEAALKARCELASAESLAAASRAAAGAKPATKPPQA
jgi:hypothetical protein